MTDEIELRAVERGDIDYLGTLLRESELPVEDIPEIFGCLYICNVGEKRVGIGGLERYHQNALLRSVAIEESERNKGYGKLLCKQLFEEAQTNGVSTVYLLTTTADGFFRRLGFENVDRETVPRSIQRTSEFSDLCPSTAICMQKNL